MMRVLFFVSLFFVVSVLVSAKQTGTPDREPGTTRTDEKGISQVWVPAGCFTMGADDAEAMIAKLKAPAWVRETLGYEAPAHEVCLTAGYWIDQYEVTNKAYQAFVDDGGYTKLEYWSKEGQNWLKFQTDELPIKCEDQTPDHPRVCVTWYEAQAYANWRSGRLPTEAEWEYAARGPKSLVFPWGNEWDTSKANVVDSKGLTPVGSFKDGASWVGAYDMAGNAMEWVQDWLDPDYAKLKVRDNPSGPAKGYIKIEKGGWWGSNPFVARASYKHYEDPPEYQDHHIGFRIMTPDGELVATETP
jgi:formylglycine-generating enzyme required for sulfatase activity